MQGPCWPLLCGMRQGRVGRPDAEAHWRRSELPLPSALCLSGPWGRSGLILSCSSQGALTKRRSFVRIVVGTVSVHGALGGQLLAGRTVHKRSCRAGNDRSDRVRSNEVTAADRTMNPGLGHPLSRWFEDPAENAEQSAEDRHALSVCHLPRRLPEEHIGAARGGFERRWPTARRRG